MSEQNNPKSLSQQRFGDYAEGYVSSDTHAKGADLDRLLELARPQSDWLVLDIATGGGHTALKFAPHVAKVVASDLTPQMLAAAEKHIRAQGVENVEFKQVDAEDLPFTDNRFDLVTCRIAPHHFPHADQFVLESARVLKPGGLFLLQDHVLPEDEDTANYVDSFEKFRDPSHHCAFSENEWLAMVRVAELEVLHTEQIIKRHDFLTWAKRQDMSEEGIAQLQRQLTNAPPMAADWLQAENLGTPRATFVNHHIILLARKK
ncbi:MAG: class I SAM-dependent methyltransferase [Chloroflexi bacterium]|nr:MAG: class I SAM-dependent methyltransferase [Chloroflexota bacterium]MBL1193976.1 class I SAM-dependent methyltransferase [Chloroflexota bacterium]NOH11270.1 class I SAM-dependent methyltransferase [Chloroflexota bacterium]